MKTVHLIALASVDLLAQAALTGCATSPSSRQAAICPDCKEVVIQLFPDLYSDEDGVTRSYWRSHQTLTEHVCTECQGNLVTRF